MCLPSERGGRMHLPSRGVTIRNGDVAFCQVTLGTCSMCVLLHLMSDNCWVSTAHLRRRCGWSLAPADTCAVISCFTILLWYFGLCGESSHLKPRPYQQQCSSNIVECYKLNDSFDNVECCFDFVVIFGNNVAGFGNNVERNFVLSTKSK